MAFWYLFLEPHQTAHHSDIGLIKMSNLIRHIYLNEIQTYKNHKNAYSASFQVNENNLDSQDRPVSNSYHKIPYIASLNFQITALCVMSMSKIVRHV